jgi:hypothetical protein
MNQLGQACLRFSALLHTRIIQEVLPALENVIAVMVADLQRHKFLPTRSHTHGETAVLVENVAAVRPSDWESWTQAREVVRVKCKPCNGKGVISNSCRCHGKGKVLDKAESDRQGVPVMKACDRCGGRGYARLKFSTVIEGVNTVAEIKKTAAYEQLQPLFEELVAECHKQESMADSILSKVTR